MAQCILCTLVSFFAVSDGACHSLEADCVRFCLCAFAAHPVIYVFCALPADDGPSVFEVGCITLSCVL